MNILSIMIGGCLHDHDGLHCLICLFSLCMPVCMYMYVCMYICAYVYRAPRGFKGPRANQEYEAPYINDIAWSPWCVKQAIL